MNLKHKAEPKYRNSLVFLYKNFSTNKILFPQAHILSLKLDRNLKLDYTDITIKYDVYLKADLNQQSNVK